jgi:hypothetical protein
MLSIPQQVFRPSFSSPYGPPPKKKLVAWGVESSMEPHAAGRAFQAITDQGGR